MPELHLFLDGTPLAARPGQTLGAALTDAGILSWRTTRKQGRPRGLFCGIGVCFDCLVTVDGVPNQRACLTPARDGMVLETGGGASAFEAASGAEAASAFEAASDAEAASGVEAEDAAP